MRLVAGGAPHLPGRDMAERRLLFLQHYDWIRTGLMFDPRGHDMMSGSILYPPANPANDMGVLFIETSGCLPMCGHGTIGTVTIAIEEGLVQPREPGLLRIETPAGLVEATYFMEERKVRSVRIVNVPSFLYAEGLEVECPEPGMLTVDVAWGGNFYAIVEPQGRFRGMEHYTTADLIRWSPVLRRRLNERHTFVHPLDARMQGLSHVMWVAGSTLHPDSDSCNAVFYGDKAIDRSPCGTGTSARMAQLWAKGQLKKGDTFVHESIIGSCFTGRVEGIAQAGDYPAIIPSIEGWARITGYNHIIDDEDDPYAFGFQVV